MGVYGRSSIFLKTSYSMMADEDKDVDTEVVDAEDGAEEPKVYGLDPAPERPASEATRADIRRKTINDEGQPKNLPEVFRSAGKAPAEKAAKT